MRERNMASWCSYHPVVSPNASGKAVVVIIIIITVVRSVCKAGQETYSDWSAGRWKVTRNRQTDKSWPAVCRRRPAVVSPPCIKLWEMRKKLKNKKQNSAYKVWQCQPWHLLPSTCYTKPWEDTVSSLATLKS